MTWSISIDRKRSPGISSQGETLSESTEKAIADIRYEIEQTDTLLETYADLLDTTEAGTPSLVELTAVASVVHSFYNGIENMLLTVAKIIDRDVPTSPQWHRDLLLHMSQPTSTRTAVISEDLAATLINYMAFRHFYRHSYSFVLSWDELEKLVRPLSQVWGQTKAELCSFLSGVR